MIFSITGFVIEGPGGRLFGPFTTCDDAMSFLNNEGRNIVGPLCIRVVMAVT